MSHDIIDHIQHKTDSLNINRLAIKIESKMHQAHKLDGRITFYPEQFIGFCSTDNSLEKVIGAFKLLGEQNRIDLIIEIKCQYNHKLWSGNPYELGTEKILPLLEFCSECNSNLVPIYTCLRAELSEEIINWFKLDK